MPFGSLWLQVVIAAVAVFLLSSIAHMVLRHHRADYRKLPDEEPVAGALRKVADAAGVYMIPYCDPSQMKDPAVQKKFEDGPVAIVTILPRGGPNLGKHLTLWFGFCLFVSFTVAYVARHTLAPGAEGMRVMQITGAVAFAAYGLGYVQDAIWHGMPWPSSFRGMADALAYALATGAVFCWMWPAA